MKMKLVSSPAFAKAILNVPFIILLGIVPTWPAAAASNIVAGNRFNAAPTWPATVTDSIARTRAEIKPTRSTTWPTWPQDPFKASADTVHIRTLVLRRSDGQSGALSANLVFVNGESRILYDGVCHEVLPLDADASGVYDSKVRIGDVDYVFRVRLRPYER